VSVQVFVAANARDGLARIRRELGDDAVVLSTRPHPQGVQILASAYGDLAYITVEVVDQNDAVVKYADNTVTFELQGVGELIAVGSANPLSEELYVGSQRKAYQGRLMAVVRSAGQPGEIRLKASAEGLKAAQVRLSAVS